MHLCVIHVDLMVKGARGLKDKRAVIKSLKDRLRRKFNVSVAETGKLNKWQAAELSLACLSNDRRHLSRETDRVIAFVEAHAGLLILDHSVEFL